MDGTDVGEHAGGAVTRKIITEYVFPPIPNRNFDWSAVTDNYEPGCPIGYGPTEQAAIDDLRQQIEDAAT